MTASDLDGQKLTVLIADLQAQVAAANATQRKALRLRLKACRMLLQLDKLGRHKKAPAFDGRGDNAADMRGRA